MNKTYNKESIIPIDGGYVIVDKEIAPKQGDWTFNKHAVGSSKGGPIEKCSLNAEKNWAANMSYNSGKTFLRDNFHVIIASIGIRIEGVPLIELPDEAEEAYYTYHNWNEEERKREAIINMCKTSEFVQGYKASEKKYTEADIRKAIKKALLIGKSRVLFESNIVENHQNGIIQSLQTKVPINVILEYEHNCGFPDCINEDHSILKVNTETNTIIPKSIEYE